ncbi:MAG: Uma2 family endonuclease [Pseudomonadota bacterium]
MVAGAEWQYGSGMNAITLLEDYPRHRLTLDDVFGMMAAGMLDRTAKYELFDGVVFEVPSENPPHIDYKSEILRHLNRTLSDDYFVVADATLKLSPHNAPSPDVYVFPAAIATADLKAEEVCLVIEVADTTVRDDLGVKAALYARYGVQEYWVVDIARRAILVHRAREGETWAAPVEITAEETATSAAVPDLKLRLADLKRVG